MLVVPLRHTGTELCAHPGVNSCPVALQVKISPVSLLMLSLTWTEHRVGPSTVLVLGTSCHLGMSWWVGMAMMNRGTGVRPKGCRGVRWLFVESLGLLAHLLRRWDWGGWIYGVEYHRT